VAESEKTQGGDTEPAMTGTTSVSDRVREAFRPTPRGVVGLVDDLVNIGRDHALRLDHADGACRVYPDGEQPFDVPVLRSVFRAALARLAALCDERTPDSVTPYGGAGMVGDNAGALRVTFANTPAELCVDLRAASSGAELPTTRTTEPVAPAPITP
jgi:hypothetical protein